MNVKLKKRRYIEYLLVVIGIVVYVYHSSLFFDWVVDDAGISFGFAKNIANGYGAVLNPGSEVVEGYSNPLWVLIISIFIRANIFEPYLTTNILGLLLGVTNLVVTYLLTRKLVSNKESILIGLPSVFLAFSTPFVAWSLSGLETPLYSLLLVLSAYTYILELEGKSKYPTSGLLLFLVAVTRPEGFGFFALMLAHRSIYSYNNGVDKRDIIWLLLFIIPFGLYHAWHYSYFGFIMPNTFYYKTGGSLFSDIRSGYRYILPFFIQYRMWLLVLFIPIIFINSLKSGLPVLANRFYSRLVILLMVLGGIVFALATGGDWMMELRFIAPVVPFAVILVYIGMRETASVISKSIQRSNIQFASLAIVVILVSGLVISPSLSASPEASANPTVPIEDVETHEKKSYSIAQKSDTLDNATLLVPDMGAHAYYGDLRYIDLAGLADVTIGHNGYERNIFGNYIFQQKKPTIIQARGTWAERSYINSYDKFQRDYTSAGIHGWYVRKSIFTSSTTEPQTDTNTSINNHIKFSGYTNQRNVTYPGGNIHYTGYWGKIEKTNQSYRIKVQITKQDNTLKEYDREIIYGWYPTSQWKINKTYFEHYKYNVPESLNNGTYNVSIIIESSSSSFSKKIVDDEIIVSSNRSSALAEKKYRSIADSESTKQKLQLAEQAHKLNPNNKTYQLLSNKFEDNYDYEYIQLAKKSYQNGDYNTAREYINKVGNNLLDNRTANNLRRKVSNEYVKKGDLAKKQGNISGAYKMYKTAVTVYGKNSEAIRKRTKIQHHPKIRYSEFVYEKVPENATSVRVEFSDKLDLVGYELQSKDIESGTEIYPKYYFECQQEMDRDYILFSHHEGKNRKVNSRNRFRGSHTIDYPTSKCKPGDIIMTSSFVKTPSIDERTSVVVRMGVWNPDASEGLDPNVATGNVSMNNGRVEVIEYNLTA